MQLVKIAHSFNALPDRAVDTVDLGVSLWLREHPGVSVVSADMKLLQDEGQTYAILTLVLEVPDDRRGNVATSCLDHDALDELIRKSGLRPK